MQKETSICVVSIIECWLTYRSPPATLDEVSHSFKMRVFMWSSTTAESYRKKTTTQTHLQTYSKGLLAISKVLVGSLRRLACDVEIEVPRRVYSARLEVLCRSRVSGWTCCACCRIPSLDLSRENAKPDVEEVSILASRGNDLLKLHFFPNFEASQCFVFRTTLCHANAYDNLEYLCKNLATCLKWLYSVCTGRFQSTMSIHKLQMQEISPWGLGLRSPDPFTKRDNTVSAAALDGLYRVLTCSCGGVGRGGMWSTISEEVCTAPRKYALRWNTATKFSWY